MSQLVARREHSLLSLMELSRELTVSLDLYAVADVTLFNLMGQIGTSRAAFWMSSGESNGAPVLVRNHGVRLSSARAIGTAFGKTLTDLVMEAGSPILLDDLSDVLGPAPTRLIQESGIALFAPVLTRAQKFGLIALGARINGTPFSPLDLQVLQSSAGLLGVALENTGLYNRLLESHRQLRTANDGLLELDRLKSEFLRNVNHEIRTPLTVIIAYLDFLLEGNVNEEKRRVFLKTAADEGQKLRTLLEKLLDFSALSEDRFRLQMICANPGDLVANFFAERLPGVTQGLREFAYEAAASFPDVSYDPHALRAILDALVDNAVKFTPQGSRISLRALVVQDGAGESVSFEVSDDGPGIATERLPYIFESFRQGDGSTTRRTGGLGIGLALAAKMARTMGGSLTAWSEPGQGTRMTLRLPAAIGQVEAPTDKAA